MFFASLNPYLQVALVTAWLDALLTRPAAALLTTPQIDLYSAYTGPVGSEAVWADFTVCNFAGYAAVTGFTGGLAATPSNNALAWRSTANFTASTGIVGSPQNAVGYLVSDGAANVYFYEPFPAPIPFVNPYDFVTLDALAGIQYRPSLV